MKLSHKRILTNQQKEIVQVIINESSENEEQKDKIMADTSNDLINDKYFEISIQKAQEESRKEQVKIAELENQKILLMMQEQENEISQALNFTYLTEQIDYLQFQILKCVLIFYMENDIYMLIQNLTNLNNYLRYQKQKKLYKQNEF